jgi:uncharacterized protein (TIGR02246 family)
MWAESSRGDYEMTRLVLCICIVILGIACALGQTKKPDAIESADSQRLTEVKEAINKGNAQWIEGWKTRDAAMVAGIFAEEGFQLAGSGKVIKGPKAIMERQKIAMQGADPGVIVTLTTVNVWLDGDVAYETGKYKYEYTEKGKPGKDEGRYVTIWKRQKDGSWKLVMDMGVPQD